MLDIVDAADNELVWRGMVTETLTDDPRKNDRRIHDAIRKLLDGFPPGKGRRTRHRPTKRIS